MDTDAVYLGRVDKEALDDLRVREEGVLLSGAFEPRTIYVLDVRASLAAARHLGPDDLITVVDHRIVLLPHGRALAQGLDQWPASD